MPLVSVIIPNYNHAKFLNQRIDSVLNQTFQDFELIILDDKSPDHSLEIIEQYKNHPKVSHIVVNEINGGSTFIQWNRGVALAKGEWIWLAESDDYCEPNFLETMLAIGQDHPSIGVAFANSHFVDTHGTFIHNPYSDPAVPEDPQFASSFVAKGKEFCGKYILSPIIGNASSAIFKKEVFEKIGGADINLKLCGDWKMWHEMLLHTDLGYSAEKLNYFRHHTNNVRSTKGAKYFLYELVKITFDLYLKIPLNAKEKSQNNEKIFRMWVFWMGKRRSEIPKNIQLKIFLLILQNDFLFLWRIARWPLEKSIKNLIHFK